MTSNERRAGTVRTTVIGRVDLFSIDFRTVDRRTPPSQRMEKQSGSRGRRSSRRESVRALDSTYFY